MRQQLHTVLWPLSSVFVCLFVLVTRPGITQETLNSSFHCGPRDVDLVWETLRVSLPGSLSSSVVLLRPTQSQWDGTAIYVVMRATRDIVSKVEGREINLRKPLPQGVSNASFWRERRARYHCAIAPSSLSDVKAESLHIYRKETTGHYYDETLYRYRNSGSLDLERLNSLSK